MYICIERDAKNFKTIFSKVGSQMMCHNLMRL